MSARPSELQEIINSCQAPSSVWTLRDHGGSSHTSGLLVLTREHDDVISEVPHYTSSSPDAPLPASQTRARALVAAAGKQIFKYRMFIALILL